MRITEGFMGCVTLSYVLKNGQDFNPGSAGGSNGRSLGAGLASPACIQDEENMKFNWNEEFPWGGGNRWGGKKPETRTESLGQDPWVITPRGENGNPLQYSYLENPMDREPGRLQSMGLQSQVGLSNWAHTQRLNFGNIYISINSCCSVTNINIF